MARVSLGGGLCRLLGNNLNWQLVGGGVYRVFWKVGGVDPPSLPQVEGHLDREGSICFMKDRLHELPCDAMHTLIIKHHAWEGHTLNLVAWPGHHYFNMV